MKIIMNNLQVKNNFRTAITIPEKSWARFRDIFADYVDKMSESQDIPERAQQQSGKSSSDIEEAEGERESREWVTNVEGTPEQQIIVE